MNEPNNETRPNPAGTEYYTGPVRKLKPKDDDVWFYTEDEQKEPDETPESKQLASKLKRLFYDDTR